MSRDQPASLHCVPRNWPTSLRRPFQSDTSLSGSTLGGAASPDTLTRLPRPSALPAKNPTAGFALARLRRGFSPAAPATVGDLCGGMARRTSRRDASHYVARLGVGFAFLVGTQEPVILKAAPCRFPLARESLGTGLPAVSLRFPHPTARFIEDNSVLCADAAASLAR